MTFAAFAPSPPGKVGFHMLAGLRDLRRLMVAVVGCPRARLAPMQVHQGDEVPRVRSGQILIRCRDQRRTWREGAPVVVALGVAHGFRVATETVPGVVAEADIGTLYPGVSDGGEAELAEPYRGDGRPPGQGQEGERACGQATGGNGTPRHSRLVYRISSWTWNAHSCPSMHGLSGSAGTSAPATLIQSPARAVPSRSALAGYEPPPEGTWLWVTEVDGELGGVFTADRLPAGAARASGGDVVLRLAAGPGRLPGLPAAHAQVYAVLAGTVVAEWGLDSRSWT